METVLKVLRIDDENDAPGQQLTIPLGWEFEETKQAAFKLAYPGNGDAPWECKLETVEGVDIDDMSLVAVVPSGIIIVNPGESFVDQGVQKKDRKTSGGGGGTLARLRGSFMRKSKDDKEDKEKDAEEKEKEKKDHKRLSFFGSVRKAKVSDFAEKDAHLPDWLRLQKRIFTRYVNQKFRSANSKTRVDDLAQDCKDGVVLCELLELMSGKSFGDKKLKPQKVRIKQIDNCATLLNFVKECGITTDCSAENIVDGEEKPLMSLIYLVIIKYMKLDEDDEDSAGMDVKQSLLMWLRNKLQGYSIEIDDKNICKAFQDGIAFCALLHRLRPRLIPFNELIKEQKIKNLTLALDVAEQFAGVQQYVEPTDIAKLDELGMIVYLSDWYHGVTFMELQNSCARRVGKLIRMTIKHDAMKAEFDERAKIFSDWIEYKVKELDDHTFDNTLEGIRTKLSQFYDYKTKEKSEKVSEQMDIEALYEDLALRLAHNQRPVYNPPNGLSVPELRKKMKDLETSENNRNEAMQKELTRQNKLAKLAARFKEEAQKLLHWIGEKETYLKAKEVATSIASAQKHLNVLASFNKEWESVKQTKLAALKALAGEIAGDNYKDKASINSQTADIDNKFHNLAALSEAKSHALAKDLETEKKKEQLRLDFAAACKDLDLYVTDQVEVLANHSFGETLEEVLGSEAAVAKTEQEVTKALGEKKAQAEALWDQLEQLRVTENLYTSYTPAQIVAAQTKVQEALKARQVAHQAELERQKANDALCQTAAAQAAAFSGWLGAKKAAVSDKAQALEDKLALVRAEHAGTKAVAEAKIAELEALDAKILAADIGYNRYAKSTTREAKIALEQYLAFIGKLLAGLEAEHYNKTNKGVTQEQRQEIADNFAHFDKDSTGFLDKSEFRACLQSLGLQSKPADVREALAAYGREAEGKLTKEDFTDYMLKRIGDTDTKEEIIDDFTTINQKEVADLDHLTAVVHEVTFTQAQLDYLLQEMKQVEGGWNFQQWTEEVFAR